MCHPCACVRRTARVCRNAAPSTAKILVNLPFYKSRTNCRRTKRRALKRRWKFNRPRPPSVARFLIRVYMSRGYIRMCMWYVWKLSKNCSWLDTLLKIARQEFAATMSVEIARALRAAGARHYEKGK